MTELGTLQCGELSGELTALDSEAVKSHLQQLDPQWAHNKAEKTISHTFSFKNYYQTMAFVNVAAQVAHQQDHHPDMLVSYNRCTVTYSTHSVGGLSVKDFICAAKVNAALAL